MRVRPQALLLAPLGLRPPQWVCAGLLAVSLATAAEPQSAVPSGIEFFENRIRPVLANQCFECHSAESKRLKGGLRLDTPSAWLKGGDSGPAVVPHQPEQSLLLSALQQDGFEMPPSGALPASVVRDFRRWIEMGAPSPTPAPGQPVPTAPTDSSASATKAPHWAFQPIQTVVPPTTVQRNWERNPIDAFILAQLESAGLQPSSEADPKQLRRRASFDVTGLPPSPPAGHSGSSYESYVDTLLAHPGFGPCWGRKWLDLARYADTNGADENYNYLQAWRYRDYVIRAFNQDKPYDQFLTEQLAGDLLPPSAHLAQQQDQICATGFLTLGPKMLAEQDKDKLLIDIVDEQIDVVSKTTMGLTIGCARCHDHKFDPISAQDYYALAGIFASTQTLANTNHVSFWTESVLPDPGNDAKQAQWETQRAALKQKIDNLAASTEPTDEQIKERKQLEKQLKNLTQRGPDLPKAMAVTEATVTDLPIHIRGSHLNLTAHRVPRGVPTVLGKTLRASQFPRKQSGRLELAQWLTQNDHPLTARVIVNRIWQGYFGTGLVTTPSNFGLRGSPPSHPELLDWLATELLRHNWSQKHIHRLILTSATYRQSSHHDPSMAAIDPDNRNYWRQNRRRLSAEAIRDSLLLVAADLDDRLEGYVEESDRNETYYRGNGNEFRSHRRAIYLPVIRGRGYEMFNTFDYSESGAHLAQRPHTTVPHQALFMMNSPLVRDSAERLASRLTEAHPQEQIDLVRRIYLRLFGRPATHQETQRAQATLHSFSESLEPDAARTALGLLIHSLMATNEFIYVD